MSEKGRGSKLVLQFTDDITNEPVKRGEEESIAGIWSVYATYWGSVDALKDGDTNTFWGSQNSANYVQINDPGMILSGFSIYKGDSYRPTSYTIETSDDGSTFTSIKTGNFSAVTGWEKITLSEPVTTNYVRIKFGYSTQFYVYELKLHLSGWSGIVDLQWQERLHVGGPLITKIGKVDEFKRYPAEFAWNLSSPTSLDNSGYIGGYSEITSLGSQIAINYFGSGYEIAKAFDKSTSTMWYASGTVDRWIGLDFGSNKKVIRKFRVYISDKRFDGFVFEAAKDDNIWVTLISGNFPYASQWSEYTLSNEVAYRYYRLRCTSVYSGSNVSVSELEVYEQNAAYSSPKVVESGVFSASGDYKIKWLSTTPSDTSIVIEYATGSTQGQWISATNGETITSDTNLWLKATLVSDNSAVTPTLESLWVEVANPPKNKLLLVMRPIGGRFNNAEGNIEISYNSALGLLAGRGGLVESFVRTFLPEDLEPVPNPYVSENINISNVTTTATRTKIYYVEGNDPENIEISFSTIGVLTHVDDL